MRLSKTGSKDIFIIPVIVIAQFFCTSLWFAGNAIVEDLTIQYNLGFGSIGAISSAVQAGFIVGTLTFAIFTISDRFSPSKVFFISAISGAACNLFLLISGNFALMILSRFFTGFFLAGIYPVGMKIASDHKPQSLGKALGYLVGALVLGTAFPHLLKGFQGTIDWQYVIFVTSLLAVTGGAIMLFLVPDGPYRRKSKKLDLSVFWRVFKNKDLKAAATGYFGHMWELYTFWAFLPVFLLTYFKRNGLPEEAISYYSFIFIAIGSLGCVAGGYIAMKISSAKTAFVALFISFSCCLLSPLFLYLPTNVFFIALSVWGLSVIADSPQFSTLVAGYADGENKGTALTIVNCLGFALTVISIQLFSFLLQYFSPQYLYMILALGPLAGLISMRKLFSGKKYSVNTI
jgi:MFS family permease